MASIELESVSKVYGAGVRAVNDISLDIADGEFMVLVGPSGCGKSTLLRMICGLEEISEGRLLIGGKDVTSLSPRDRDIAMVFQNYALYPHMTVRKNLGFALKIAKMDKAEIDRRVDDVAKLLALEELLERRPSALSGGQRQRVAMGRAIVREPAAYLMDEPLSNLDAKLRVTMRSELSELHLRLNTTTVYVTHDQIEAMTLGQRVAVMSKGLLQQVDTPHNLYNDPKNLFVAAFIGSPSMNLVQAESTGDAVSFGGFTLPLPEGGYRPPSGRVVVGIRPEALQASQYAPDDLPQIEITASVVEDLGAETNVLFAVNAAQPDSDQIRDAADTAADTADLISEDGATFTARIDPRAPAKPGGRMMLSVDNRRMYFFDPDSGVNLMKEAAAVA